MCRLPSCRKAWRAQHLPLPELSEVDVVRHFTRLSQLNYCIDMGIYPLGSCTMKYNPKINEETARLPGFAGTAPAAADRNRAGHPGADVRAAGMAEGDRRLCRQSPCSRPPARRAS